MKHEYARETLVQGRMNQSKAKETPNAFAIENGAAQVNETNTLDAGNPRMAGTEGARALRLRNDPEEAARTMRWMDAFGLSNQGMEWNQAKMGGMGPPM